MKRPGYDARRRNRNIGTAKQGHGQDNDMRIPERWSSDRVFYENLKSPIILNRKVHERELPILLEPTTSPFIYPCTVADVVHLLNTVPKEYVEMLDLFVFRHPTHTERNLRSVWGRLVYAADLGRYCGTTIYIESQREDDVFKWGKSLDPRREEELERLRSDGHEVEVLKRHIEIRCSSDSMRTTLLHRTILHELGHLEDWLTDANYETKTSHDKEVFAHRFAEQLATQLTKTGILPFERLDLEEDFAGTSLKRSFFGL